MWGKWTKAENLHSAIHESSGVLGVNSGINSLLF